ncbi:electron carrier mycofactocin [Jatrophihabitans fulvus]
MSDPTTDVTETAGVIETAIPVEQADELVESTLVEEVSIDGMCGVY